MATASTAQKSPIASAPAPSKYTLRRRPATEYLNFTSPAENAALKSENADQSPPILDTAALLAELASLKRALPVHRVSAAPKDRLSPKKYTLEELKSFEPSARAGQSPPRPGVPLSAELPPTETAKAPGEKKARSLGYDPINPAPIMKGRKLTDEDLLNLKRAATTNAEVKAAETTAPFASDKYVMPKVTLVLSELRTLRISSTASIFLFQTNANSESYCRLSPRAAVIIKQLQENREAEKRVLARRQRGDRSVPDSSVRHVPGSFFAGARVVGPIDWSLVWNDFRGFLWNVIVLNILNLLWFIKFWLLLLVSLAVSVIAVTNWLAICDPWTPYRSPKWSFASPSWVGVGASVFLSVCANTGALRQATANNLAVVDQFTNVSLQLADPVISHADFASFTKDAKMAVLSLRRKQDYRHTCISSETIKHVADLFSGTPAIIEAILEDSRDYFAMIGLEMNDLPPNVPNCEKGFKQGWKHERYCQDRSSVLYGDVIANQLKHTNRTLTNVVKGERILEELGQHLVFISYIRQVSSYRRDQNHKEYFRRLIGTTEDSAPDQCRLPDQIDAYQKILSTFGRGPYVGFELAVIDIAQQLRVARSRLERLLEGAKEENEPRSWRERLHKKKEGQIDEKFLALTPAQIDAQIRERKHVLRKIREKIDYQRDYVTNALGNIGRR
jgi:hypothetical protein